MTAQTPKWSNIAREVGVPVVTCHNWYFGNRHPSQKNRPKYLKMLRLIFNEGQPPTRKKNSCPNKSSLNSPAIAAKPQPANCPAS